MNGTSKPVGLLHKLVYAAPTSGTIRMGRIRETEKGNLPVKDDEFRLTTKVKAPGTGDWEPHQLDDLLRKKHGEDVCGSDGKAVRKLRRIPVTIVYDRPELTVSEQLAAFSSQGVPLCVGDGETAMRRDLASGETSKDVCSPRTCRFGQANRCDAIMRLLVRVEGQAETEPPMILRTGSFNAVTDNRATLEYWSRMFGCRLAGLPFDLVLEAKQTAMSRHSRFYFARLVPAFKTAAEGATLLNEARKAEEEFGINRAAAEDALLALRGHGSFEEDTDDGAAQFDDLIAGRFTVEVDGEQHRVSIGLPTAGIQQPPKQAAADAVMELASRLSSARPAAVEPPAAQADIQPAEG